MEMESSISRRTRSRSEAYLRSCIHQTNRNCDAAVDRNGKKQSFETEKRPPMVDEDDDDVSSEEYSDDDYDYDDELKGSRKAGGAKKRTPMVDEDKDEIFSEECSDDECELKGSRKAGRAPMADQDKDEVFSAKYSYDDDKSRKVGRPKKKKARVVEEDYLECMLEGWRFKERDFIRHSEEDNSVICKTRFRFEDDDDDDEKSCKEKTDWEKEMDALFDELQWGLIDACTDSSIVSFIFLLEYISIFRVLI